MINLIPPSAKKSVIKEYWKRVITVWLFLCSATAFILSVFLLPTYMLLTNEISVLDASVQSAQGRVSNFDVSATELTATSKRAQRLLEHSSKIVFSELTNNLESYAGANVELRSFDFSQTDNAGVVKIAGLAKTRQSLADFKDKVAADKSYTTVDLPISNLIKDKDLLFSIDVGLATSTKDI